MFTFEHHRYILCACDAADLVGNLLTQPLLNLQLVGKLMGDTRKLRETQYLFSSDVAYCNVTPEWNEMMLAGRPYAQARYCYHLVNCYRLKSRLGGTGIVFDKLAPRVGPTARRIKQTFTIGIFP